MITSNLPYNFLLRGKTLYLTALSLTMVASFSRSVHAAPEVSAGYSAGSKILDISTTVSAGPNPITASIGPLTIPAGPNAQGIGAGSGYCDVHIGSIKLFASNSVTANPSLIPVNLDREGLTEFHGTFQDTITVTSPGVLNGVPLVIFPVISTHYGFGGSATGFNDDASFAQPSFGLVVLRNTGVSGNDYQQRNKDCFTSAAFPSPPCPSSAFDTWALSPITVKCGVPFDLSVYAQAAAGVRTIPGGSAHALSDLSTTVNWLGVAAVTLTNLTVLSNFTFTSQSGTNFGVKLHAVSNAIPNLTLEIANPDEMTICWQSVPYQLYRLESRSNLLASTSWQPVGSLMVGDGTVLCLTQPTTAQQKYFRVACVPNP